MAKKYSPTVTDGKPAMKLDADGHFIHRDDYFKAKAHIEELFKKFGNTDPSLFYVSVAQWKEEAKQVLQELEG